MAKAYGAAMATTSATVPLGQSCQRPRGVARLHCGDAPCADADREAKLRRAAGVIAGRITARHTQLHPPADGRVKCIDELTPTRRVPSSAKRSRTLVVTYFVSRWTVRAKHCVVL
jgi:hypothetical protein